VVLSVEDAGLVGDTVEDLLDHDCLEDDDEDVEGGEEVAGLGHEFPLSSVVNALDMVSILNGDDSVNADDDLGNAEDAVIDDEDLGLLLEDSELLCGFGSLWGVILKLVEIGGVIEILGNDGESDAASNKEEEGVGILVFVSASDINSWNECGDDGDDEADLDCDGEGLELGLDDLSSLEVGVVDEGVEGVE